MDMTIPRRLITASDLSREDVRRFRAFVDDSGDCWRWTGSRSRSGGGAYGRFSLNDRIVRATAVALAIDGRPLRDGEHACHHCDTPDCVRPEHLFRGTNRDNALDAAAKGRIAHGERHGGARLTDVAVTAIRASYPGRYGDLRRLAAEYGVAPITIRHVVRRETWR
jgi:hypothetical protein